VDGHYQDFLLFQKGQLSHLHIAEAVAIYSSIVLIDPASGTAKVLFPYFCVIPSLDFWPYPFAPLLMDWPEVELSFPSAGLFDSDPLIEHPEKEAKTIQYLATNHFQHKDLKLKINPK